MRLFLIVLAIATIIMNLESRLRIFSLALSLLLLILYYWRAFFTQRMIERFHKVLFVLPIILFFTAVSGVFNPFKLDELVNDDIVINANTDKEESLTVDTRTFLWVETLSSLVNNGTIVIGEGAAGRYASDYFDMLEDGRGRYGSETFILNIWLYLGIVGVILMGTIFYYASFLAIKRSNNYLSKVLGLLIVIYWCLIFVGINSSVNLDTFFIWITLGLCMSNSFRAMSDMEMKQWVRGITDKRYRLIK